MSKLKELHKEAIEESKGYVETYLGNEWLVRDSDASSKSAEITKQIAIEFLEWCHHETVQFKEGYFFTPEQLNEYTANVVRQALETAAQKAELYDESCESFGENQVSYYVDEESITNTFEETFQKYKV